MILICLNATVKKIIDGDTIDVTDVNLGFGIVYAGY